MNYLVDRTTSTHPVSIGTSILLESIVKGSNTPYDDTVINKNNCSRYNQFCINVYTLCRNILSSCKSEYIQSVTEDDLRAVLMSEISYISQILTGVFSQVKLYYCEYNDLKSKYPYAKLMSDNTDKQKHVTNLIVNAVSDLIQSQKQTQYTDTDKIHLYKNNFVHDDQSSVLMFTNQALNLLDFKRSDTVCLIESHTAHMKSRPLWYSKLHTAKQETWLPFNHITLQVFGDNSLFSPLSKAHRDYVIFVGKKFQWNTDTSVERMRLNLSFDRENPIRHNIMDLFK